MMQDPVTVAPRIAILEHELFESRSPGCRRSTLWQPNQGRYMELVVFRQVEAWQNRGTERALRLNKGKLSHGLKGQEVLTF